MLLSYFNRYILVIMCGVSAFLACAALIVVHREKQEQALKRTLLQEIATKQRELDRIRSLIDQLQTQIAREPRPDTQAALNQKISEYEELLNAYITYRAQLEKLDAAAASQTPSVINLILPRRPIGKVSESEFRDTAEKVGAEFGEDTSNTRVDRDAESGIPTGSTINGWMWLGIGIVVVILGYVIGKEFYEPYYVPKAPPAPPLPAYYIPDAPPAPPLPSYYIPDAPPAPPLPSYYIPDAPPAPPLPAYYIPDASPAQPAIPTTPPAIPATLMNAPVPPPPAMNAPVPPAMNAPPPPAMNAPPPPAMNAPPPPAVAAPIVHAPPASYSVNPAPSGRSQLLSEIQAGTKLKPVQPVQTVQTVHPSVSVGGVPIQTLQETMVKVVGTKKGKGSSGGGGDDWDSPTHGSTKILLFSNAPKTTIKTQVGAKTRT